MLNHKNQKYKTMKSGIELIQEERQRQIEVEKWDYAHDEIYDNGEMMGAAGCYIASALSKHREEQNPSHPLKPTKSPLAKFLIYDFGELDFLVNSGDRGDRSIRKAGWVDGWPWGKEWDKRKKHDKIRSLVIAGALIAAELDQLNKILNTSPSSAGQYGKDQVLQIASNAWDACKNWGKEKIYRFVTGEIGGHPDKEAYLKSLDVVPDTVVDGWISVEDGLPEINDVFLCYTSLLVFEVCSFDKSDKSWDGNLGEVEVVTHYKHILKP